MSARLGRLIGRMVDVRAGEGAALAWSGAYHFFILTAYYILRPIRDEMGVLGGVENLAWLFTGTLAGMTLLHPFYSALVARLPRRRFIPWVNRFFLLNLVVFYLVLRATSGATSVWVGRVFFIWVSVFNLFVVSVFWSFMADLYRPTQSRRLFGIVAVGGTLGAVLGSSLTSALVGPLGPVTLLLVSALFLELASQAARRLDRQEGHLRRAAEELPGAEREERSAEPEPEIIGGGVLEGIGHVLRSPYLLGIAALMLFFTISSTFLYFQQAAITREVFGDDSAARTRLFANMDLAVNVLTLLTQLFVTGRILRWLGVGVSLAFLPVLSTIGFAILGVAPGLGALVVLQVLRRAGNFAIQRPAREVLYTVLPRTDKYKAKNFNDTFVYRVGDQIGGWSYTLIAWLGLGISGLSFIMVPFCALWIALAVWLGRKYRTLQGARAQAAVGTGEVGLSRA